MYWSFCTRTPSSTRMFVLSRPRSILAQRGLTRSPLLRVLLPGRLHPSDSLGAATRLYRAWDNGSAYPQFSGLPFFLCPLLAEAFFAIGRPSSPALGDPAFLRFVCFLRKETFDSGPSLLVATFLLPHNVPLVVVVRYS